MERIDIESEFGVAVRRIGGAVLADELGPSPPFQNADYLFRAEDVVGELKCLERDTRSERPFRERVTKLHWSWVRKGLIPAPAATAGGTVGVSSASLPPKCTMQILELLRSRLQAVVKKANRQIEQTRREIGLPSARGLLLLANDGDLIFEADCVFHLLHRVMKERYRHINTIVYFTTNLPVTDPGLPMPAQVWTDLVIDDGGRARPVVHHALIERLRDAWFNHLADLVGGPTLVFNRSGEDPDRVAEYRFIQ